ncbi:homeobox-DDT domain protein RLT2-like protein [Tanacetum coccineum]
MCRNGGVRPQTQDEYVHKRKKNYLTELTDMAKKEGKLLMAKGGYVVWKFLITFADVLGVWSFTLDKFVEAPMIILLLREYKTEAIKLMNTIQFRVALTKE